MTVFSKNCASDFVFFLDYWYIVASFFCEAGCEPQLRIIHTIPRGGAVQSVLGCWTRMLRALGAVDSFSTHGLLGHGPILNWGAPTSHTHGYIHISCLCMDICVPAQTHTHKYIWDWFEVTGPHDFEAGKSEIYTAGWHSINSSRISVLLWETSVFALIALNY
jgi:hypothetical protein